MRRWTKWGLIAAGWGVVTLVYSSHLYFFHTLRGVETTWPFELAEAAADFLVWAALTPFVFWLAGRVPFGSRALFVHVPASLAVSLAQVALHTLADRALVHGDLSAAMYAEGFTVLFARTYHFGLLVYWTLVVARWAVEHYKNQQLRASRLEAEVARAQLDALKMQLHPHFLFNTLNAISALMHRDVAAADRMLARLSELLRLALDAGSAEEVPLSRELEFLEKYLEIEKVRFGDRLSVDVSVAAEALEARVPNLLLQPLVENAVRHGVSKRREGGRVEIRAARQDGFLELSVSDDGAGLPEGGPDERIGLSNTRRRLEQLYGRRHRFELRNRPGGGLEASIAIPFRSAAEEA
jgi:two-component system LytT family sensor kinase